MAVARSFSYKLHDGGIRSTVSEQAASLQQEAQGGIHLRRGGRRTDDASEHRTMWDRLRQAG